MPEWPQRDQTPSLATDQQPPAPRPTIAVQGLQAGLGPGAVQQAEAQVLPLLLLALGALPHLQPEQTALLRALQTLGPVLPRNRLAPATLLRIRFDARR